LGDNGSLAPVTSSQVALPAIGMPAKALLGSSAKATGVAICALATADPAKGGHA
jgi:hypothetical protein